MILSIDFRTDIPAFYSTWLVNRFNEGFVMFRNPASPNVVHKIILDNKHVEGIIWCSKDYLPILHDLKNITDKFPSVFHYTITGYGNEIEPGVPPLEQSIYVFRELSMRYGKEKVIWRFDPIFYHPHFGEVDTINRFEYICKELHNYTDRVVINFCTPYEKVKRHMSDIIFLTDIQKKVLIFELLNICKKYNLKLQTCGNGLQFKDLEGVEVTGCLDEHALNLMGIYPKAKNKATQWGCLCYPNTSIGEYNTCLHRCQYCYASSDFVKCLENWEKNDHNSPLLIGNLKPTDTIIEMKPKLLNTNQLKLNF
jgi:hypothetical protein